MSEPQLVIELSQAEAVPSNSSNAAKSAPYSPEEDKGHKYHNYMSRKVTKSTERDRGQGHFQGSRGRKQTSVTDGEALSDGQRTTAVCAATSTGWSARGSPPLTIGTCTTRKGRENSGEAAVTTTCSHTRGPPARTSKCHKTGTPKYTTGDSIQAGLGANL